MDQECGRNLDFGPQPEEGGGGITKDISAFLSQIWVLAEVTFFTSRYCRLHLTKRRASCYSAISDILLTISLILPAWIPSPLLQSFFNTYI